MSLFSWFGDGPTANDYLDEVEGDHYDDWQDSDGQWHDPSCDGYEDADYGPSPCEGCA